MQKIFAANWKMYKTRAQASQSAGELANGLGQLPAGHEVVVFAPFTSISCVADAFNGKPALSAGAQNCYPAEEGAFTGETSPAMLRDADDLTTIADLLPLRPMTLVDLDTVMVIEERAYPFPWTRRNFQDCLKQGYLCQVYEQDDKIMAYAVVMLVLDEMHLLNICIDPHEHGKRLGSRLLQTLEHKARGLQAETCFLEVRQSNFSAIRLYLNAGFNEVGIRKGYYPAALGREDAIVMAKALL